MTTNKLRRTRSSTSLSRPPAPVSRTSSTASTYTGKKMTTPPVPVSILSTPSAGIHVVPRDSTDESPSPKIMSNPFQGRLLDLGSPNIGRESHEFPLPSGNGSFEYPPGRESHEVLDEVNFNSPNLRNGRAGSTGQFAFQDHEDDDEDYTSAGKIPQHSATKSKYATVSVAERHGLEEDDVFLDEKTKPQQSRFAAFFSRGMFRKYHELRQKYPKSMKAAIIILLSLAPLFMIAFVILVILATTRFQAPMVYATNALDTTALEAGVWGFNFTRAMNFTMVNKSPMAIDVQFIDIDVDLARLVGHFAGNGSAPLGFTLGPKGDFTTFLLPMKFYYDATADTNGDTLEVLLQGCGLVSGATGNGITIDMVVSGNAKIFSLFNKGWTTDNIGGILQCDTFLKDAVRIMGQLRGDTLSSKI